MNPTVITCFSTMFLFIEKNSQLFDEIMIEIKKYFWKSIFRSINLTIFLQNRNKIRYPFSSIQMNKIMSNLFESTLHSKQIKSSYFK